MKKVIIVYEGAADVALDALEGRTPLQVARCYNAARLAETGRGGLLAPVQDGLDGRNEVFVATLCGVPTAAALALQRGPLEALAAGDNLTSNCSHLYRGNFVTVDDGVMTDGRVSGLSEQETGTLAEALQAAWDPAEVAFRPAGPGHLLVGLQAEGEELPPGYPPCLMEGESVQSFLPGGREGERLRGVMERAARTLEGHPVNEVRVDLGENPANGLWLWGGGRPRALQAVFPNHGRAGVVLSQSRMAEGYARAAGMNYVPLSEPWRSDGSEASFKVAPLVEALRGSDFLLVYVEAPQELGRYGSPAHKIRALERADQNLLGPLLSVLEAHRPYRILLVSDGVVSSDDYHPTSGSVPMVLAGEGIGPDETVRWDEVSCAQGALGTVKTVDVMTLLTRS